MRWISIPLSRPRAAAPLLVGWLLLVAPPASAQQQAARPAGAAQPEAAGADRERVVSRVYDVRDLLVQVRDYPFRGTLMSARQTQSAMPVEVSPARPPGTMPAAAPGSRERSPQEREDELVRLVTETVAPESWRDAGGTVGAIRVVNGPLIITQTQENHGMIQHLFEQLRETRARMVRVRAHWLLLSPADAEKLVAPAGEGRRAEAALPPVDPAALRGLPKDTVQFQAQTVGFNTQTVHVVSGPARTIVSDVDVQIGTAASGFDPVVELVRSGLVLEVTPVIAADGKSVTIDLYSAFVDPVKDARPLPVRALAPPPAAAGARAVGTVTARPARIPRTPAPARSPWSRSVSAFPIPGQFGTPRSCPSSGSPRAGSAPSGRSKNFAASCPAWAGARRR